MIIKKLGIVFFFCASLLACKTQVAPTEPTLTGAEKDRKTSSEYNDFFTAEKARIKGDRSEARKLYEDYVITYKKNPTAFYNLSKLELYSYQFQKAEVHAKNAVDLDPNNKYFLDHYADVLNINKKFIQANKIYAELEKKYPNAAETYIYNQFRIYKMEADYDGAIKSLDRLEELVGISEEISSEKSELYIRLKQTDKAIKEIEKLIADEPNNISYKSRLADLYENVGEKEKAKKIYEELLLTDPSNPELLLSLSTFYLKMGDTVAYKKKIDQIITNPDLDANYKLAVIMPLISRSTDSAFIASEALPMVEKVRKSAPNDRTVDGLYADMLFYSHQYPAAKKVYRAYLAKEKSQFAPWFNLMLCHSNLEEQDSLVAVATESLDYFPNNALAHYFKATGHYQLKQYKETVTSLQKAVDLEPEKELLAQIHSLMGDSYNSLKQYTKSDEQFKLSLQIKEEATTLNNFAYYLSLRNENLEEALKMSKRSLELEPNSLTFMDTYGWIFYKKGDYQKAKEWIEKAIDPVTGGDPDVLEHLGDIYFKLSDPDNAKKYWQRAKNAKGGSEFLDKKILDGKLYE